MSEGKYKNHNSYDLVDEMRLAHLNSAMLTSCLLTMNHSEKEEQEDMYETIMDIPSTNDAIKIQRLYEDIEEDEEKRKQGKK